MTDRPLWVDLSYDSSREEVLAAVAQSEARVAAAIEHARAVEFPAVPEGYQGCVASTDGSVIAMVGPTVVDSVRAAQDAAGEEDQTLPTCDSGA